MRELSPEPEGSPLVKMEPMSESEVMASPPELDEIQISPLVRALFQAQVVTSQMDKDGGPEFE